MHTNELKSLLTEILAIENPPAIMLHGAPGVGKSAIVEQIAQQNGWGFKDIRLLLLNAVDLKGVPVANRETKITEWYTPEFLPREGKDAPEGIMILDEITSASPSMQAAAYQLVYDKKIGDYTVPKGWRIIAAGNRMSDRGVVNKMPSPLANRMMHFDVEPGLDDWKGWALNNGIHPSILGFLNYYPQKLYEFPKGIEEIGAFPSPRSWMMVNKYATIMEPDNPAFASIVHGAVGAGVSVEYTTFAKIKNKMPDPRAILATGKGPVPKANETDILFALCAALATYIVADPTPAKMSNLLTYMCGIHADFAVRTIMDMWKATGMVVKTITSPMWSSKIIPTFGDIFQPSV